MSEPDSKPQLRALILDIIYHSQDFAYTDALPVSAFVCFSCVYSTITT